MASPRKKWYKRRLAELAEQEAKEAAVQPEPVAPPVEPKKILVSNPDLGSSKRSRPRKSSRSRKKKE